MCARASIKGNVCRWPAIGLLFDYVDWEQNAAMETKKKKEVKERNGKTQLPHSAEREMKKKR